MLLILAVFPGKLQPPSQCPFDSGCIYIIFCWLGRLANATPENVSLHSWSMRRFKALSCAPQRFALFHLHKLFQPFSFFVFFRFCFWVVGLSCHSINGSNIWTSLSHRRPTKSGTLARHFHTNISMKSINEIAFGIASYAINRMRARFP